MQYAVWDRDIARTDSLSFHLILHNLSCKIKVASNVNAVFECACFQLLYSISEVPSHWYTTDAIGSLYFIFIIINTTGIKSAR